MTGNAEDTADTAPDAYAHLVADLDAAGARYRLIDHPPEGRTERVSAMRGHPVAQGRIGRWCRSAVPC